MNYGIADVSPQSGVSLLEVSRDTTHDWVRSQTYMGELVSHIV